MNSLKKGNGKKKVTKDGGVVLQVIIPEDLYKNIVRIAPMVYGKARGGLSYVVREALKMYLNSLQLSGVAHTKHTNPPGSVRDEFNKLLRTIKSYLGSVPLGMRVETVRKMMIATFTRCKDERTQNKKLHLFYLMGFIKPLPHDIKPKRPSDWNHIPSIEFVARGEV